MFDFERPNIEVAEISEDKKYGRFVVEPLERGYGITLGNSLRRIMLSSLPGAAVSQVKIEGVLHEFSSMEGVKEDVTEIIMNIKSLAIKNNSDKKEAEKLAEEKGWWEQFRDKLVDGALNMGMQWAGHKIDQLDARATAMRTTKAAASGAYDNWKAATGATKATYAENFEKSFGMSPDTYGKWSSSTNKADKKSLKNVFKGSSSYNEALSNDTGSMLGKAISNSTKGDSSGKSWAEYQACVQNNGGNCNTGTGKRSLQPHRRHSRSVRPPVAA